MLPINHKRTPVLFSRPEDFKTLMHGTPEAAFELVRPYPPENIERSADIPFGAHLATADGLVFTGEGSGNFSAFDATRRKVVEF